MVTLVKDWAAPTGCAAIARPTTQTRSPKVLLSSHSQMIGRLWNDPTLDEIAQRRQAEVRCGFHNFSQEIRRTPRITSAVAPIFRGVSVSTSLRSSIDSGRTKREEAFTSGEIIETRSRLSAV